MKRNLLFIALTTATLNYIAQDVIKNSTIDNKVVAITSRSNNAPGNGDANIDTNNNLLWFGTGAYFEIYGNGTSVFFTFQEVTPYPGADYTFDGLIENISTGNISTYYSII